MSMTQMQIQIQTSAGALLVQVAGYKALLDLHRGIWHRQTLQAWLECRAKARQGGAHELLLVKKRDAFIALQYIPAVINHKPGLAHAAW